MDEEGRQSEPAGNGGGSKSRDAHSRVDWDVALEVAAGDVDLLIQVLDAFRVEVAHMMKSLHEALEAGDAKLFHRCAHTAKNAFYNIGARETGALAFELEKLGKAAAFDQVPPLLKQLETHAEQIDREVDVFLREKKQR
ncbi:MAG: Hpt domain-containing protein [Planctomycetota bacterium]